MAVLQMIVVVGRIDVPTLTTPVACGRTAVSKPTTGFAELATASPGSTIVAAGKVDVLYND